MNDRLNNILRTILFGTKIEYLCPFPLEDCLEYLQSKADQRIAGSIVRAKVRIKITFVNMDDYTYSLKRYKGRGEGVLYGRLKRWDDTSTVVIINDPPTEQIALGCAVFGIIIGIPILQFLLRGDPNPILFLIFAAIFFLILRLFFGSGTNELKNLVIETLPK